MLLLSDGRLDERRRAIRGPLAPLFRSLSAELEPLFAQNLYVPESKALLSRAGGICEADGARLDFDPASPHLHLCPACGRTHSGELHHRAWVTSYQLWLAERSVHAALFHALTGEARYAALARDILNAYSDRYLSYPNRDNVLGPTRLFFSTYLESIWLLQICVAADLLRASGHDNAADLVADRIVAPSSELIAGYDEGMSNRQVWNNAALLAAAAFLGDERQCERVVEGRSGVLAHLSAALLADGTWFEGENYHQFAIRGLWYAVTMCEARGRQLETELSSRLSRAFETPYLTALPDFTMASRKDSQYKVSLRQWRQAETAELGFAREQSAVLGAALARCYAAEGARTPDTGRARSTADIERNGPRSQLTRADLGWRALLHALPELPPLRDLPVRSALLEGQGLAVFRRERGAYVAVDYGQSGGGHGHPDRLNLVVARGDVRWLDDLGTGSYLDPSLHWYRSTLAHNAPLVNGKSQSLRDGTLRAYDERGAVGWIVAELELPGDGVRLERTVVVSTGYVIDELRWQAGAPTRVELPLHLDAVPLQGDARFHPAVFEGGRGLEDGFDFVSEPMSLHLAAGAALELVAREESESIRALVACDADAEIFSACGPSQPAATMRRFLVLRGVAPAGIFRTVLVWDPEVRRVEVGQDTAVVGRNGEVHRHQRLRKGWRVDLEVGEGAGDAKRPRSSIDLGGWRDEVPRTGEAPPVRAMRTPTILRRSRLPHGWYTELGVPESAELLKFDLGERHYRRSEESWNAAGSPAATVGFAADDKSLLVFAQVRAGHLRFAPQDAVNPFDNEHPDTLAAGVQLYVRAPDLTGGWMLVPELDGEAVRVRPITGWEASWTRPSAKWRALESGYELRIELALPVRVVGSEYPLDVDLVVNETAVERQRRRGQLVMSGSGDEFVYLRGDRHDATRLIPLVLVT